MAESIVEKFISRRPLCDLIATLAKTSLCDLGYDALIMISGAEDKEGDELSDGEVDERNTGTDQIGDVGCCLDCHD